MYPSKSKKIYLDIQFCWAFELTHLSFRNIFKVYLGPMSYPGDQNYMNGMGMNFAIAELVVHKKYNQTGVDSKVGSKQCKEIN